MAKKCETTLEPSSMDWCEGDVVYPGIRQNIYYVPKSHIVKWPKLPTKLAAGETMDKLAIYVGDFELAEGKDWKSMVVLVDKSPASSEVQGEKPSKTFINRVTAMVAKTDETAAGFSRVANNGDYVYLLQQKDGKYRVVGNEMYQTNTNPGMNLGASPTDEAGMSIEIDCTDVCHHPFYNGKIMTEDGDANAPEPEEPGGE